MSNEIRIFLGFLGLIALISVFTFFNSFGNSSSIFPKSLTGSVLEAVDQDVDKDGLTNREESYWNTDFQNPDTDGDGFLDGEEVASGHDPAIAGPNDLFVMSNNADKSINLTQKLSLLIASGLYSGDLKKSINPKNYNDSVDKLSLAALYDGVSALSPEETDTEKITTITNAKRGQEEYASQLFSIIEKNLLGELLAEPFEASRLLRDLDLSNPENNQGVKIYFLSKAENVRKVILQINNLGVPQAWTGIHKDLLTFLRTLELNYNAIGFLEEDPLKALIAFNQLKNTYPEAQPILASMAQKVKKEGLRINNNEFLNLINNLHGL